MEGLKGILGKLKALGGSNSDSEINQAEEMKRKSEAYRFNPEQSLPPEVLSQLRQVLKFHDDVLRDIVKKLAMVPGLTELVDGLSTALNACEPFVVRLCDRFAQAPFEVVYTVIAPYVAVCFINRFQWL